MPFLDTFSPVQQFLITWIVICLLIWLTIEAIRFLSVDIRNVPRYRKLLHRYYENAYPFMKIKQIKFKGEKHGQLRFEVLSHPADHMFRKNENRSTYEISRSTDRITEVVALRRGPFTRGMPYPSWSREAETDMDVAGSLPIHTGDSALIRPPQTPAPYQFDSEGVADEYAEDFSSEREQGSDTEIEVEMFPPNAEKVDTSDPLVSETASFRSEPIDSLKPITDETVVPADSASTDEADLEDRPDSEYDADQESWFRINRKRP